MTCTLYPMFETQGRVLAMAMLECDVDPSTAPLLALTTPTPRQEHFHLRYVGRISVESSMIPNVFGVAWVHHTGGLALLGRYFADKLPQLGPPTAPEYLIESWALVPAPFGCATLSLTSS